MSEHSTIEWTEATWTPVVGCSQVSEGCRNCYAETLDRRFRLAQEGTPYRPWTHPNAAYNVRTFPDRLALPLRWKRPRMVFVNSRSDLFHEAIPAAFREEMWRVMREATRHTFQILTKRPENIAAMLPADWGDGYPNVWLGVSAEDESAMHHRGETLLLVPARVRFISAEPWLANLCHRDSLNDAARAALSLVDWVILGGESGHGARPMREIEARAVRDACVSAGVPFFFKQWGGAMDKRSHEAAVLDGRRWTQMPKVSE